jgi:hypothetical protein
MIRQYIEGAARHKCSERLIAFPLTVRTAHRLARQLRTDGFWTMSPRIWNGVADLVEVFAEDAPTPSQLAWLATAHRQFLGMTR